MKEPSWNSLGSGYSMKVSGLKANKAYVFPRNVLLYVLNIRDEVLRCKHVCLQVLFVIW